MREAGSPMLVATLLVKPGDIDGYQMAYGEGVEECLTVYRQ
jgi:hypothetical protein